MGQGLKSNRRRRYTGRRKREERSAVGNVDEQQDQERQTTNGKKGPTRGRGLQKERGSTTRCPRTELIAMMGRRGGEEEKRSGERVLRGEEERGKSSEIPGSPT